MLRSQYNEYIKEYFDITDRDTRKVLVTINEADQNQVMGALASKLYNAIVKRVTDIDFGQIPNSRGDITKIPDYLDMVSCLTTIRDMMVETKQSTKSADIIFLAIENMKKYQKIWEKGYVLDNEMTIVFYNTIALSIVSAISLLTSATVEFVKNPDSDVIDIELSKIANHKSKDNLLFTNLDRFNKACKKGDIEKIFNDVLRAQRQMKENATIGKNGEIIESTCITESIAAILFTGAMVIGLLSTIIPILHQLTSALFCLRQKVAEYFAGEADIIRLNAEKVQYNRAKSPEQKKKIIARQHKIADRFKKWSNKLMITANKADIEARKMIKDDRDNKNKIGDIVDEIPDSASIF